MNPMDLQSMLSLADQKRNDQLWAEAILLYRQLENQLLGNASYHHNLALCLLGNNQPADALAQADRALAVQSGLWQSAVVKVRALSALGRPQEAASLLEALRTRHPERVEFTLELATIALHDECDAGRARALVQPFLDSPAHAVDARLTDLMACLYDRDENAKTVNQRAMQFAQTHLDRSTAPNGHTSLAMTVGNLRHLGGRSGAENHAPRLRLRLGLLSPHFNCSPVFFFCRGALQLLASEFDLYFFSRSQRTDWATQQLQALATQWFDVANFAAEALDSFIRLQHIDVLLDLGGWMDPIALKAISTKPAKRMYKWVGGQSISTGLRAFDGFISDEEQTPAGYEPWFTEPLLRLPNGYVTYTPPDYMPPPVAASAHSHVLGIISNPVKVSQPFLVELNSTLLARAARAMPVQLRFIDKRYHQPKLKARILAALLPAQTQLGAQLSVAFIVPSSHQAYLAAVGQLSEMVDTFPYTGGLTTMEALTLGVACRAKVGTLFCERHTHAHLHYAQRPLAGSKRSAQAKPGAARQSLLPLGSPRTNHAALAASLAQLFVRGTVAKRLSA